MNNNYLSLSSQFQVELLRRFIKEKPQQASELALKYYEEYWVLHQEYKALQKAFLESRNDYFILAKTN